MSTVGHLENGAAGRSITANPTALSRKSEFNQWSLQSAPRQLVHCAFLSRRLPSLPRAGQVPINNNNNNWLRRPANPYNWNGPAGSVPSGALQNRASLPVIAVTCKLIATLLLLASHFAFFSAFAFQFSCQARSLARSLAAGSSSASRKLSQSGGFGRQGGFVALLGWPDGVNLIVRASRTRGNDKFFPLYYFVSSS